MDDQNKALVSTEETGQLLDASTKVEDTKAVQKPEEETKAEEVKRDETPALKYSEEDLTSRVKSIQSAKDTEIGVVMKRLEELQGQYNTLSQTTEEQKIADWLKSIETGGGDVDQARLVANAQRQVTKALQDLAGQKRSEDARASKTDAALKILAAHDLVKKHSLGDDAIEEILSCDDASSMEVKALTLKLEKVAAEKAPAAKIDSAISTKSQSTPESAKAKMKAGWGELHKE